MRNDPMLTTSLALIAGYLMVEAGKAKNQLVERVTRRRCPSCGRNTERSGCACTGTRKSKER